MAAWIDGCRFTPTLGGTTDWTFSVAVTGYMSPALAGVTNGQTYKYRAEVTNLSEWELGEGTYNTGTGVLTRTTVLYNSLGSGTAAGQSGAGTKINFGTVPQVAIVAMKEDMISISEANVFTAAQRAQARANAGASVNDLLNVSFAVSASAGALTIALKDAAGNDATAATPVALTFRNATLSSGPLSVLEVTAASSVVVPSTSTCGFLNATAARLWITGWNDGGTFRLGVFNASSASTVFVLAEWNLASSLQVVAAGNSAGQHYTAGAAVTTKAFRILGYVDWNSSGVATAGTWTTTNLNSIVTFGPGVKKPGEIVQQVRTDSGAVANGSTQIPYDDTIPQITEGDQYLSQAVTPSSFANLLRTECQAWLNSNGGARLTAALYNTTYDASNALVAMTNSTGAVTDIRQYNLSHTRLANTVSATTFTMRAGNNAAVTTTFNGENTARRMGGVANSYIQVFEIMG